MTARTGQPEVAEPRDVPRDAGEHDRPEHHRPPAPQLLADPVGDGAPDGRVEQVGHGAAPAGARRPFQRRQPRRTSLRAKKSSSSPSARSTPATAAATRGCWIAKATTAEHRDVLEHADADVGDRLGRGVDRQPQPGLGQVRDQRRAAADRGQRDLVEPGVVRHVAREQRADDGADGGPDQGGDHVPGGVDVGDLVGDELHRVEEPRDRQHVPAREHVRDVRAVADLVRDAEHQHHEVGVDATGPAARERQRQGLHAGSLGEVARAAGAGARPPLIGLEMPADADPASSSSLSRCPAGASRLTRRRWSGRPVIRASSSYVVENTAAGCPAAAHTTSYCWSWESSHVGTGAGWAMGETPPITWPVCSRTNSGLARFSPGTPIRAAVASVSTRCEPEVRISTGEPVGVEEQAVGDRADLAAERLGGQCGGVDRVGQNDDLTGPAEPRVRLAEPDDGRVLGLGHGHSLGRSPHEPAAACVGDVGRADAHRARRRWVPW